MIRKSAIFLCTLLGFVALASAQEPATPAAGPEMPCATLLYLVDLKEPGTVPDTPTAFQMAVLTATMKLLASRIGGDTIRARLGITAKSETDPLWYGQATVSMKALLLYDRQYCVDHPLNSLSNAVENLARQVQSQQ